MEEIISLCKRRGFIYPSSEIYGGFSATYDYGPIGVLLKNNIKNAWWKILVQLQDDVVGLDSAIFSHPKTWKASGHVDSFSDPLVEDKVTHERLRADHLIEEYCDERTISPQDLSKKHIGQSKDLSEFTIEEMALVIDKERIKSPKGNDLTPPRTFNLLVEARLGATEETKSTAYLRGETCQAIFLQYKNILNTMRVKIPFGVAQVGKAFRNEITTKQFILRTREFEQMEFEYFVHPDESFASYDRWEKFFKEDFLEKALGVPSSDIRLREIPEAERSHYAKLQKDFEIKSANGKWIEVSPMNHRGNWDLSRHAQFSGEDFTYIDSHGRSFTPNVIETSFGVDRLFYVLLEKYFRKDKTEKGEERSVLSLPYSMAPIKCAVFPLVKNKESLVSYARDIYHNLKGDFMCEFDDNGNIGKRYRRQDEIGTPYCVTIDYQTLEDNTLSIRHRDSMKQERIGVDKIKDFIIKTDLV